MIATNGSKSRSKTLGLITVIAFLILLTLSNLGGNLHHGVVERITSLNPSNSKCEHVPFHGGCLQSENEIDNMIKEASQVVITMPAKAAGSTMKQFTNQCMGRTLPDNFLNNATRVKEVLLTGNPMEMPKIIVSHLMSDNPLRKLIEVLPKSSLLIYIHREESDRLLSAINHVYRYPHIRKEFCNIALDAANQTCIVGESLLIKSIEMKIGEIGMGGAQLLTCDTYDAIEENMPNMVFVHYKQADRLQRVLAKYHCPDQLEEKAIKTNAAQDHVIKTNVRIAARPVEDVDLKEWVDAKANMLQFAIRMREGKSCQSKTREMEELMFTCETEFVHVSRTDAVKVI